MSKRQFRGRIYIAGPMTGLPEWNFPAFHAAAAAWRAKGWDVVNPADSFDGATDRPYTDYVREDLKRLQTCGAMAMLPGWDSPGARGSVWEREIALTLLGLIVYDATVPVAAPVVDHGIDEYQRELWSTAGRCCI
jgi:hypothetical protein